MGRDRFDGAIPPLSLQFRVPAECCGRVNQRRDVLTEDQQTAGPEA